MGADKTAETDNMAGVPFQPEQGQGSYEPFAPSKGYSHHLPPDNKHRTGCLWAFAIAAVVSLVAIILLSDNASEQAEPRSALDSELVVTGSEITECGPGVTPDAPNIELQMVSALVQTEPFIGVYVDLLDSDGAAIGEAFVPLADVALGETVEGSGVVENFNSGDQLSSCSISRVIFDKPS